MLEGKVALVTGGSRGIGAAIVRKFADYGAKVWFTYARSEQQAQQVVQHCPDRILAVQADISDAEKMAQIVEDIVRQESKIEILVNNAGIARDNLLLRMRQEEWDQVLNVNLKSAFLLIKAVTRHMLRQRSGSIINISSVVGQMGNPGQANYAAAKAGLIGLTLSVARELGSRGIRCNAVAPGFIETDMTASLSEEVRSDFVRRVALGRLGKPEEVAEVVAFLASDRASYITGQVIRVCGGLL